MVHWAKVVAEDLGPGAFREQLDLEAVQHRVAGLVHTEIGGYQPCQSVRNSSGPMPGRAISVCMSSTGGPRGSSALIADVR